jgi:hypothetical protein
MEGSTKEKDAPQLGEPELVGGELTAEEGKDLLDRGSTKAGMAGLEDGEKQSMLDWFLSDEQDAEPVYPCKVNVGTLTDDFRIWKVRPIGSSRIDEIRRMCQIGNRASQRQASRQGAPQVDVAKMNAILVFEGSVDPDLREALATAQRLKSVSPDVAFFIHNRFKFKPLLVDQIAGEILRISGADEDDVQTAREVLSAGN